MARTYFGYLGQRLCDWKCYLVVAAVLPFVSCTTTQTSGQSTFDYYSPTVTQTDRPFSDPVEEAETRNFAKGNFPFGIGAKFDLAVADEPGGSGSSGNLYKDYIQPLRRGKIMSRTPVELNYSILPSSGDAFYHSGGLDNEAIKSKYKLQVGMSRNIYKASDFLKADFWLAKGKFNPNKRKVSYQDISELNPFSEEGDAAPEGYAIEGLSDDEILENVIIPSIR